jgi:hypothetical protein
MRPAVARRRQRDRALAVAVTLLILTGYLAAVETVVQRINVVRALRLVEEERRGAPALLWLTSTVPRASTPCWC